MSVKVKDKMPMFKNNLYNVLNDALSEGAKDILVKSRHKAPFRKGQLRADSETHQVKRFSWRVSYYKEYARFQEFGGDSKRRVRNYTTAGTGKAYLKSSGDEVTKTLAGILKKHAIRAKA